MSAPHDPTRSFDPLDGLIAAYLQAVEAGEVPDREAWLDRHPEHADALRAFFADLDRMDRVAAPLRPTDHDTLAMSGAEGEPDAAGTVRYFGDYEILEKIAQGGMGVVYKARQTSLNRLVALKMVLRGALADVRAVARFRAEAEAAANLDHPHIVPIHEVGEHDGQQYYAMKFVEGHPLSAHPRGTPRAEAAGLRDVARAVHYAHQRAILHRDLKPSNILVDPAGVLHVADFGLAKRLDNTNASISEPGAILGTPRYMAPEQAAGRRDLTVAADVYSLGVILYERLTGRPPFDGDNVLTLLRQARESAPPRPSTFAPGLDRDLETIILKCLDKDPARRYSSASDLADDLTAWLADRPIAARPVGQAERLWLWCRRNPIVASLTAGVAASLVVGIVASTYFAIKADARAQAERRERLRAEKAEATIEGTFARSLIAPLDPNGRSDTLSGPERMALWELSRHQDDAVVLRFLDQTAHDSLARAQLFARSEPAILAAVGLDGNRRTRARRILLDRIEDPSRSVAEKTELALIALELGDEADLSFERLMALIIAALKQEPLQSASDRLHQKLASVASRLSPATASRCIFEATEALLDQSRYTQWAWVLDNAAPRLEPEHAFSMAGRLGAAILHEMDGPSRARLASSLDRMLDRLGQDQAFQLCRSTARALADAAVSATSTDDRRSYCDNLAYLAKRLPPEEAGAICLPPARMLANDILSATNANHQCEIAGALDNLAGRLDRDEAARLCGPPAFILADLTISDFEIDPFALANLDGFWKHLSYGDAAQIMARWIDALTRTIDSGKKGLLIDLLASVSSRLDTEDLDRLTTFLVESLVREDYFETRVKQAEAIAVAARRLKAPGVTRNSTVLREAFQQQSGPGERRVIATALTSLTQDQDADEAARSYRLIEQELERELSDPRNRRIAPPPVTSLYMGNRAGQEQASPVPVFADCLKVLAPKMSVGDVRVSAERFLGAFQRGSELSNRLWMATCISHLSKCLPDQDALRICEPVLKQVLDELSRVKEVADANELVETAELLSTRLGTVRAARIWGASEQAFIDRLAQYRDSAELAVSVVPLSPLLGKETTSQAAEILLSSLEHEDDSFVPLWSGFRAIEGLATLAGTLKPASTERIGRRAIKALLRKRREVDQATATFYGMNGFEDIDKGLLTLVASGCFQDGGAITAEASALAIDEGTFLIDEIRVGDVQKTKPWLFERLMADADTTRQVFLQLPLAASATTFPGASGAAAAIETSRSHTPRSRLSVQQLVDLLKMPTCYGEARRVVLDYLGYSCGRYFVNHWAFVRYARETGLDRTLDLTSPPKRPDPEGLRKLLESWE